LPTGGSGGELTFGADDIRTEQAIAGRFELTGAISVANGVLGQATGVTRARAVALTGPQRAAVGKAVSGPLESVLPTFAEAARLAIDRAAQSFEVTAPWSATASNAITFAWTDQLELKSSSGLVARMTPVAGASDIMTASTAEGGLWRGAGTLALSGGGAPHTPARCETGGWKGKEGRPRRLAVDAHMEGSCRNGGNRTVGSEVQQRRPGWRRVRRHGGADRRPRRRRHLEGREGQLSSQCDVDSRQVQRAIPRRRQRFVVGSGLW
jgi:hypothetical protein